ncbi:hypothetical protein KVR01_000543 [Diaporthe batatas]|uniref:uncharacterized protein n=1 Tax=Diaporthe batatas TaxID=748121 RepID=UPI001D04BDAA|nr:uncharacterized protein KVR01_000543 [Diaporthe batatas]KAG8169798.1 hypothetical protein KVR01_000543 [Diaporthe batatas]
MSWFVNTEQSGHRLNYDSRDVTQHPRGQMPANLTHFECILRRIPVEVESHCGPFPATGCGARRLRQREERSDVSLYPGGENEHMDPELFQILPWSMTPPTVANMLAFWPTAAGIPDIIEGASATDNFLAGDDALFVSHRIRDWGRDASNMIQFSRRMTTLLNTIFLVSLNLLNVTTAISSSVTQTDSSSKDGTEPFYNTTQATASDTRVIYRADRRWCATLLLVSSFLQILAIAGLCLRAWITGPDLLGFASSLTRDNPYFPDSVSSCGSALGGADRSRMCKDLRVQIADVLPMEENGYIVFKLVSPPEKRIAWNKKAFGGKRLFI